MQISNIFEFCFFNFDFFSKGYIVCWYISGTAGLLDSRIWATGFSRSRVPACTLLNLIGIHVPRSRQKLKVFNCHSVPAAFGAILSCPALKGQPAFDKYKSAFAKVLVYVLRLPTERSAIHKTGLLTLCAIRSRPSAIRRQAKVNYSRLARRIR